MKTAKLCAEQDQIGKQWSAASAKLSGRLHKGNSDVALRGMTARPIKDIVYRSDRIRLIVCPQRCLICGTGLTPRPSFLSKKIRRDYLCVSQKQQVRRPVGFPSIFSSGSSIESRSFCASVGESPIRFRQKGGILSDPW